MLCDDCKTETVFDVQGEHTCVNCGLVSKIPVLVDQYAFSYNDNEDVFQSCSKYEGLVCEALNLNATMAAAMMELYRKHVTRASERRHIIIMAVCAYATSEARTIDDICTGLNIDTAEFHKVMRQMKIQPPDLTVADNIASVRNKLCLKGAEAFEFKKRCMGMHKHIADTPTGNKILRQVKATKLFAVIGYTVLKTMKLETPVTDDLFKLLNVTKPTVKKILGIIASFS
jgi:hypothetical protein